MSAKYAQLNALSEDEFRQQVLVPLLKKMDYENVRLRHGAKEYGKDITYSESSKLNINYYAVVAKIGDISGAAAGKKTTLIVTIEDQIKQAFTIPIQDVTDAHIDERYVNQVIIWTTGKISDNAQKRIMNDLKTEHRNNIRFIDGNGTVDFLEKYYPSFFTLGDVSISNYFENAKLAYSRLDEIYSAGGTNAQKQLPAVFVSPTLEYIPKIRSKQSRQEGLPNQRYSFSKLLEQRRSTFLLGEMGSGKSTILRRLLIQIIENNEHKLQKYPIPVLIRYKNLALEGDAPIFDAVAKEYARLSENMFLDEVKTILTEGNFTILLDGLDEMDSEQDIDIALKATQKFMGLFPKNIIIIASRMMEIFKTTSFFTNFSIYKIEDFSLYQMKELITKWFGSDDFHGKQLIKLISQPMTLSTLPFTPLTLSLIAILYQSGFNELPANLTELFQKYIELALGRWDMGKDLSSQIDWKKKLLVMRKISWDMLQDLNPEIKLSTIKDYIQNLSIERGLLIDESLFFREMVERSGLLIQNLDGGFEFKHQAFMDYFAGEELNTRANSIEFIIEKFPHPLWSRAIFFACGLKPDGEGEEYLKAIMKNVDRTKCGVFHYSLQLGLIAQATYLAHRDTKIEAVQKSLLGFIEAWDDLAIEINNAYEKGVINKQIHHLSLLYIFSGIIKLSIGSTTLSGALTHLINEYIETNDNLDNSTDIYTKENEWIVFYLALAAASASNIKEFVKIFKSSIIIDPALVQIGEYEAELLLEDEWLEIDEKRELEDLRKNLQKKLKNKSQYINQLANQKPILLRSSYENNDKQIND